MARTPAWRRYARFFGVDVRRDVDEELRFHLDEKTQALIADGLSPDEARAEALRQFGAVVRRPRPVRNPGRGRRPPGRAPALPDGLGRRTSATRCACCAARRSSRVVADPLDRAGRRRQHRDLHAARSGAAAAAAGSGAGAHRARQTEGYYYGSTNGTGRELSYPMFAALRDHQQVFDGMLAYFPIRRRRPRRARRGRAPR